MKSNRTRHIFSLLLIIAPVIFSSGCSSTARPNLFSPNHPYDTLSDKQLRARITQHLATISSLEDEYFKSNDEVRKRQCRDQIADLMLGDIDEFWRRFSSDFYGRIGIAKTAIDSTAAGVAGAAAITTPARSAKVLSAVAAAILAGGSAWEKNVLQNSTADVLVTQMDADRRVIGTQINIKLGKTTAEYSLVQLTSDLGEYAASMSVPHALTSIRAKVGSQTAVADANRAGQASPH